MYRASPPIDALNRRPPEVAALLMRRRTNWQLAEELAISGRTAQGRVENVLAKLGLDTRRQVRVGPSSTALQSQLRHSQENRTA
jgi:DNA-binding CsgD family transcriptional regulator